MCLACAIGPGGPGDEHREMREPAQGQHLKMLLHKNYIDVLCENKSAKVHDVEAASGARVVIHPDERHMLKASHEQIVKVRAFGALVRSNTYAMIPVF